MSKKIALISLFFFLVILQKSFLVNLFFYNSVPDISLLVIIIWSAKKSFRSMWIWALIAGFMVDILSLSQIGLSMVSFLLVAFLVDYLSKKLLTDNEIIDFFIIMLLAIAGTFLADFLQLLFFQIMNFSSGIEVGILGSMFPINKLLVYLTEESLIFAIIYGCQKKIENIFSRHWEKVIV